MNYIKLFNYISYINIMNNFTKTLTIVELRRTQSLLYKSRINFQYGFGQVSYHQWANYFTYYEMLVYIKWKGQIGFLWDNSKLVEEII